MANICLVKTKHGTFAPAFNEDIETAKKYKVGEIYAGEIWKRRNIKFHKKWFALLNICFDNQERFDVIDHFRDEFLLKSGHYRMHITAKGKTVYLIKSISFKNMDDIKFGELYEKSFTVALKNYCKGNTREEIENNIDQILGFI
jgi:hypothetical protein